MTLGPLFALALGGLDALHVSGTFRAVLGPVGARAEQCPADGTTLGVQPIKQGCFQFFVQRQYRRPKPAAQQGVGNGLNADTFLAIIQCNTVAAVIVAALMCQPPCLTKLAIVHNGDGGSAAFPHIAAFQTDQWVVVTARAPPFCDAGPVALTDWLPCGAVRRPSIHPV